jgi:asparagine synthase (glutamine-hydrolysing)
MCGITGIFGYGADAPPVEEREVIRIRDAMRRRGPDAAGYWSGEKGRVAFGHRRLSIIDVSDAGNQPMVLPETGTCITFNGEIYNYREVRRSLEQRGRVFRTASDTEVLLHAYEEYGERMFEHIRGMYAFAIWDARQKRLFLARDPLGIKPLYYADDGETVRFASQVRALLAGAVESPLDPAACVSFFLLGYVLEPYTFRRSIHALPAGHCLWVDANGPQTPRRYFSAREVFLEAEEAAPEGRRDADVAEIVDAIRQSVAAHMIADVPVGLFLSAGMDSTGIASLASQCTDVPLRTLTLGFEEYQGTQQDEVPIAEEVSRVLGTDHTTMRVHRADFLAARDRVLAAMDQPSTDGVNTYFVSSVAAQAGLKVALSGVGGDELFGGYASFRQAPAIARVLRPMRAFGAVGRGFRMVSSRLLGSHISAKYAGLLEYGTRLEDAYLLRRALYMPWELPSVLDPDLVRAGWARLRPMVSLREATAGLDRDHARVATLEMTWYMRNQLLRDTDWAGMAHSVEVRTPLVDGNLLRQLAPHLVCRRPPNKRSVVAATPAGSIDSVMRRSKTGFGIPVREWLAGDDATLGPGANERGIRGWARMVYDHHAGLVSAAPADHDRADAAVVHA